jgi:hypothetical protein
MRRPATVLAAAVAAAMLLGAVATANTSHDGWPKIDGVLLMNKTDRSRPLDARPGRDPFGGRDARYSCDAIHKRGKCHGRFVRRRPRPRDELTPRPQRAARRARQRRDPRRPVGRRDLGDYKPSGQPTGQHDQIWGGPGRDHIYASHGRNAIRAGGGNDWIKAHFGHGLVNCGGGNDLLYISRRAQKHYKIRNCERISHKTLGR